jgi:hypothetical protein
MKSNETNNVFHCFWEVFVYFIYQVKYNSVFSDDKCSQKFLTHAVLRFQCMNDPAGTKNARYTDGLQVCVISLWQPLQSNAKVSQVCRNSSGELYHSAVLTGRSRRK